MDCVYSEWSTWNPTCKNCYGGEDGWTKQQLLDRVQFRHRFMKSPANYGGKCPELETPDQERQTCKDNPDYALNLKKCDYKDDTKAYYTEWEAWSKCAGACGSPGYMTRIRHCVPGAREENSKCTGEPKETKDCTTFCPSTGWGLWEPWTKCSVTCGKGPQTRRRRCKDELRGEMKNRSTCMGKQVENETIMCDLGPCAGDSDSGLIKPNYSQKFVKKNRRRRRRRRKNGRKRLRKRRQRRRRY